MEWPKDHTEMVQAFIKEKNKERSFFSKLKTKYLGLKYRIQDWINNIAG